MRRRLWLILTAVLIATLALCGAVGAAGPKPPSDHVPPKAPSDLAVTATGSSSIAVAWRGSHDNKDKFDVSYGVYRDGALVATTTDASYTFAGLDCAHAYRLEVDAFDSTVNRSARVGLSASTSACTAAPPLSVAPGGSDFAWAHLAATYDGSTLRLYVNGTQVGTDIVTGTMAPSTGPLRIGGNSLWDEWFAGLIDNVRIYNRTLSPTEIATDMKTPVASGAPAGLVASYSFDEGSGTRAADLSGHGNDGLLEGPQWTKAGRFGGALSFDPAKKGFVTVADSNSLDLTSAMTLEAWVRPSTLEPIWRDVLIKEQSGMLVYALYANTDKHAPSAHVFVGNADHEASGSAPLPGNTCTPEPCASFDRAYRVAKPGDVVEVAAGTYPDQSIMFDPSKTSAADVVFRPAPGAAATIGDLEFGTNRFTGGASHVTIENLTVDGSISIPGCGVPDGTACPPDATSPGNDLTFRNLRVKGAGAFYCASCSNVSLIGGTWGPDTYACRPGFGSTHPEIQSAFMQTKRAHGILIDGTHWQNFARCATDDHTECLQIEPADDLTIRNSTFRNCDTIGVNLANDLANSNSVAGYRAPNNVLIENNFFDESRDWTGGETFYALNIRECTNCVVRYNSWLQAPRMPNGEIAQNVRFVGNAGPMTPANCNVDGVVFAYNVWEGAVCNPASDRNVADVGFVDRATLDLHLRAGSPAIGAGDPANHPAADIDGDARASGPAPDAGADQRR
jgi:hypothetical protein